MVEWQFSTERCRWQIKRRLKKRDVKIVRADSEEKDFATARRSVARLPAHVTRALRVFLSKQNLICGYGGMADTLVLGTSAFGVQVQVLLPAPQ